MLASFLGRPYQIPFFFQFCLSYLVVQGMLRVNWLSRNQLTNEIPITSLHAETTNLYISWTVFPLTSGREAPAISTKDKPLSMHCASQSESTFSPLTLLSWQRGKQRLVGEMGSNLVPRKGSDRSLNLKCQTLRTLSSPLGCSTSSGLQKSSLSIWSYNHKGRADEAWTNHVVSTFVHFHVSLSQCPSFLHSCLSQR